MRYHQRPSTLSWGYFRNVKIVYSKISFEVYETSKVVRCRPMSDLQKKINVITAVILRRIFIMTLSISDEEILENIINYNF